MPVAIDDVQAVRRTYDRLVKAVSVAEGRRLAAMERLQGEFGVKSVPAAKRLLSKLRRRAKVRAEAYFKAKERFKKLLAEREEQIEMVLALLIKKANHDD